MLFRKTVFFFCICCLYACTDKAPEHPSEKHGGVFIDNSQRYGRMYKSPDGLSYNYRYMKAGIRNDSTIPLYVSIGVSKLSFSPTSAGVSLPGVFTSGEYESRKSDR
jgi:hypothetical protein